MSDMTDLDALQPIIRTCQTIVGAMIMGVATFLAIALFVTQVAVNPAPAPPGGGAGGAAIAAPGDSSLSVITYLAVASGLIVLVLSFVVPKINIARARRQIALAGPIATTEGVPSEPKQLYPAGYTGKLAQLYQTQLIIGSAMLEGAAFFATIAYMVERNPIALATAIVLLGALIARFPTSDRVNAWLDRQLGLLQEERQSAI
ncbi:MAG TPA: hypothetical protein VKF17_16005 [Isosphaeraceae bacterium]|nr:hypothetical protein [Isosphaeraceae bacterium]